MRLMSKIRPAAAVASAISAVLLCTVLFALIITSGSAETMNGGTDMNPASYTVSRSMDKIRNPDSEIRGIWIATVNNIDFPSKASSDAETLKAELDDIIATCLDTGINAVYFQVRPSCDALYDSAYFPTSAFLTGTQGSGLPSGFDPLRYMTEECHRSNIALYAWVNPLRVTTGSSDKPQTDVSALAASNPARQHPDWVIAYDDGRLYFDCGLPEVRSLVAAGCAEIVSGYDVDGIVFDDYFYPYPVTGATFEDGDTYKTYGGGFDNVADWRRDNVNQLVEACYDAIKAIDSDCEFGVAPFGIWQNDDGSNGGSDTSGLSSYSAIYCDTLAWIEGGYVDFVAPQIYWQFSTTVARFDVLVRWWNAMIDNPDIDLLVCHAAYRSTEWDSNTEIRNQVEFARSERSYRGSIMYGYSAIKNDEMELREQLKSVWSDELYYGSTYDTGESVEFRVSSPADGDYVGYSNTYIIGRSDPAYGLTFEGEPVSLTRDGYFSLYVPLSWGENNFTFMMGETEIPYTVYRGNYPTKTTYSQLDKYEITDVYPTSGYVVAGSTVLQLSVTAPSGSTVTAALGSKTVTLSPSINPPNEGDYMCETYAGTMVLPYFSGTEGELQELGNIVFEAKRGGESASAEGSRVRLFGSSGVSFAIEVTSDDSELKVGTNSWYYDDYTSASKGMRDNAVSLSDGYYKLRMGGYIAEEDVRELGGWVPNAILSSVTSEYDGDRFELRFKVSQNVPLNGYVEDGKFVITLYNLKSGEPEIGELCANPLFTGLTTGSGAKANSYKYYLTLLNIENFYGFEFYYEDGQAVASFRCPSTLPASDKPLTGKVIYLDAGHGGSEKGAPGPAYDYNEKDMNLDVALSARDELEKLGATVIMTREDDTTVPILDRVAALCVIEPDLCLSIHQNSMTFDADITRIRGTVALYYSDGGLLLAEALSSSVANGLNRLERSVTNQRLAMVRNPKFPSALVEVGFITCVEEYDMMLRDDKYMITETGKYVAQSVLDYYEAQAKYVM